jgi:hypothetical protein
MDENQYIWRVWADRVHRWGLKDLTASLLDGMGPLSILCAQAIYLLQPVLSPVLPDTQLKALAQLLEDPDQSQAFATYLREGSTK